MRRQSIKNFCISKTIWPHFQIGNDPVKFESRTDRHIFRLQVAQTASNLHPRKAQAKKYLGHCFHSLQNKALRLERLRNPISELDRIFLRNDGTKCPDQIVCVFEKNRVIELTILFPSLNRILNKFKSIGFIFRVIHPIQILSKPFSLRINPGKNTCSKRRLKASNMQPTCFNHFRSFAQVHFGAFIMTPHFSTVGIRTRSAYEN